MSTENEAKQQVGDALGDLAFPAGKERIVEHVRARGSEPTVRLVRAIPVGEYRNSGEVTAAIPADPAAHTDQTDAEKAYQRRHHTHPGLAENAKDTPANPIAAEIGENRKRGRGTS